MIGKLLVILEVIMWNIKWKKLTNSFFYSILDMTNYKLGIMINIRNALAMSPGLGLAHLLNHKIETQRNEYDLPNSGKARI